MNQVIESAQNTSTRIYRSIAHFLFRRNRTPRFDNKSPFGENVRKNRLMYWVFLAALIFGTVLAMFMLNFSVAGELSWPSPETREQSLLYNMRTGAVFAVLPHITFATTFFFIWRSTYSGYALAAAPSRINLLWGPRGFAHVSMCLAAGLIPVLLLCPAPYLSGYVQAFYLGMAGAMFIATLFALSYQYMVMEARDATGVATKLGELPKFFTLDATSYGWVGTNLLTVICLLAMFVVVRANTQLHEGWFFVENEGVRTLVASKLANLTQWFEWIFLSTLLVIGFFSGAFRTPASENIPNHLSDIKEVNRLLAPQNNDNQPPSAAASSGDEPEQQTANDGSANHASRLYSLATGLLESSRLVQSALSGILLYLFSQDLSHSICFSLVLAASYIFNDICDFQTGKDAVSHPNRPLPSGKLSTTQASIALTTITVLIVVMATVLFEPHQHMKFMFFMTVSVVYSIFLKRLFPSYATPTWCLAVTVLFVGATDAPMYSYAIFFSYFFGREILLDLRDQNADRQFAKRPPVPEILGEYTYAAAAMLMSGALGVVFLLATNSAVLGILVAGAAFTLLAKLSSKLAHAMIVSKVGYVFALLIPV